MFVAAGKKDVPRMGEPIDNRSEAVMDVFVQ